MTEVEVRSEDGEVEEPMEVTVDGTEPITYMSSDTLGEGGPDRYEEVDEIFAELERGMLSGTTEQMEAQRKDFLNAKVRIKRLF